jgi:hypothetical protein
MADQSAQKDPVVVTVGVPEADQMSSFQNGTLQNFGHDFAVTIQTFVKWPVGSTFTQQEAADYIAELLHSASRRSGGELTFEMQLGLNTETMQLDEADRPKLQ